MKECRAASSRWLAAWISAITSQLHSPGCPSRPRQIQASAKGVKRNISGGALVGGWASFQGKADVTEKRCQAANAFLASSVRDKLLTRISKFRKINFLLGFKLRNFLPVLKIIFSRQLFESSS